MRGPEGRGGSGLCYCTSRRAVTHPWPTLRPVRPATITPARSENRCSLACSGAGSQCAEAAIRMHSAGVKPTSRLRAGHRILVNPEPAAAADAPWPVLSVRLVLGSRVGFYPRTSDGSLDATFRLWFLDNRGLNRTPACGGAPAIPPALGSSGPATGIPRASRRPGFPDERRHSILRKPRPTRVHQQGVRRAEVRQDVSVRRWQRQLGLN